MARVITDGTPIENPYTPPEAPQQPSREAMGEAFALAIISGFKDAIAQMPAPVVNVPKPEVKINSPVYVTAPEIKVPPTTVNIPDGKAPVVNIEPAAVTLKTERPDRWKFTFERNEFGQVTVAWAEAKPKS